MAAKLSENARSFEKALWGQDVNRPILMRLHFSFTGAFFFFFFPLDLLSCPLNGLKVLSGSHVNAFMFEVRWVNICSKGRCWVFRALHRKYLLMGLVCICGV